MLIANETCKDASHTVLYIYVTSDAHRKTLICVTSSLQSVQCCKESIILWNGKLRGGTLTTWHVW